MKQVEARFLNKVHGGAPADQVFFLSNMVLKYLDNIVFRSVQP